MPDFDQNRWHHPSTIDWPNYDNFKHLRNFEHVYGAYRPAEYGGPVPGISPYFTAGSIPNLSDYNPSVTHFGQDSANTSSGSTVNLNYGNTSDGGFDWTTFLTGLVGAGASYYGQKDANDSNVAAAKDNTAFQEQMSSTAYRRAIADMKLAGLNPILAGKLGGASTPSGSVPVIGNEFGGAVSSAIGVADAATRRRAVKAQESQTSANIVKIEQEVRNLRSARELTDKQVSIASQT